MTTAELRGVLDALRAPLVDLLQRITGSGVRLDDSVLHRDYDVAAQRAFSEYLLEALGFSAQTGRLDVSAHPFSTTLGAADGRLTTRFYPNLLSASIFGTIHECGHGLHGLGVAPELATTELGDGTSLGICESQSRFWENLIARRRAFWEHFYPELQPRFPALADVGLDQFHQAVNAVPAVADPGGGGRGDLQPAHPAALRPGAALGRRRNRGGRPAGGVARGVAGTARQSYRRRTRTACCRISTGRCSWSGTSLPTASATFTVRSFTPPWRATSATGRSRYGAASSRTSWAGCGSGSTAMGECTRPPTSAGRSPASR